MATKPPVSDPLSILTPLSANISVLLNPQSQQPPQQQNVNHDDHNQPHPDAILLCTWMGAPSRPIAKYLNAYRALFPRARIVLIRSTLGGVMRPWAAYREVADFGVAALREALEEGGGGGDDHDKESKPRLHVHVWSNGGSMNLWHLYRAFQAKKAVFSKHTAILDSCPGQLEYATSLQAFSTALGLRSSQPSSLVAKTRWYARYLLCHLIVSSFWVASRLGALIGRPDALTRSAAYHNDKTKNAARQVRRTYMYSEGDALVSWRNVEAHADEAEAKGFVVRREEFGKGSMHVAHAVGDGERYWRVVGETWGKGWIL